MLKLNKSILFTMIIAMGVGLIGCQDDVNLEPEQPATEAASKAADDMASSTADCEEAFFQCQEACDNLYLPWDYDGYVACDNACRGEYLYVYRLKSRGNTVCYLQVDAPNIFNPNVYFRFRVADRYENISCLGGPDAYVRREIGWARCNAYDAEYNFHVCQARIDAKEAELRAQGYQINYPAIGVDGCPRPEVPDL